MHKIFMAHFILALFFLTPNAFAQEVGQVMSLGGVVIKTLPDRQVALKKGGAIELGDIIMTQEGASLIIEFIDKTTLSLGSGTELTIDDYVFDPDDNTANKAEFKILKGPFHYVSGLIGKKDNPDVNLHLDFGSIGIRGTKIWRDMTLTEDGKPQCRVYVEDGSARVSNGKGFTTLKHGDGTKLVGRLNPPTPSKPWGEGAINDIKSKSPAVVIIEPKAQPEPETLPQPETEQPAPE